ncbi:MAG TPA: IS701 family transposase [Ktedonobacteraceae bacterium]|nr:IS701 family transposase [Ktedonobacteraceae bacterium]
MTTLSDVIAWHTSLTQLHARLAPHFARPEPFQRALRFVQGMLSEVPRKNGWQLAEQAREATPYGMQRLLSQAVWDQDGVRDEIRAFVLEHLGYQKLVAALDETSFPKQGKHSAGVSRQYCGAKGDVWNCQVGVFLSLVSPAGHTLIDRELYLPREWTDDPARCRRAGIPKTVSFRTKPELAILMLERLEQAHVCLDWVTGDTVYGGNPGLRTWLERRRQPYVMAVPSTEPVVLELPAIGVRRLEVRDALPLLAPSDWSQLSLSQGTKGPRLFDWACVPVWHQGRDDGWHSLLIRRPREADFDPTFYLVLAPPTTYLQTTVTALGERWRVEEDFENSKDLGLDQYEVRSYVGWLRHMTLVMLALAFLTSLTIAARTLAGSPVVAQTTPVGNLSPRALCPLSVPEARRLLARLLFPPPTSTPLVFQWSAWRRWHQRLASFFHTRRRMKAG